jgi:yeast amino acid transporter
MFSCMGGDIVIVTAGEAKHPRKDLPSVARFMYLVPIGFYVVASLLVGLNINFMDPGLYHPWVKPTTDGPYVSQSPFIIAVSHASINVLPQFLNACFLISAYTAG